MTEVFQALGVAPTLFRGEGGGGGGGEGIPLAQAHTISTVNSMNSGSCRIYEIYN